MAIYLSPRLPTLSSCLHHALPILYTTFFLDIFVLQAALSVLSAASPRRVWSLASPQCLLPEAGINLSLSEDEIIIGCINGNGQLIHVSSLACQSYVHALSKTKPLKAWCL